MIRESNCQARGCKWYLGVYQPNDTEVGEVHHCLAFPEGIPFDIAFGSNKHLQLIKGQAGSFTYEKERD